MKFADPTNFHRKSGVAKWRDLLFLSIKRVLTQPLKPIDFLGFTARLKSCPDRKLSSSQPLKSGPNTKQSFSAACIAGSRYVHAHF